MLFSTFSVRNEAAQLTDVTEMFNNIPLCDNLRTDLNTNVRFMAARILKVASLFLPKYLYTIKQQMNIIIIRVGCQKDHRPIKLAAT